MKTKAIIISILLAYTFGFAAEPLETLTIPGTGACEEILRSVAEEFNRRNPTLQVIVPPSIGSAAGIRAVLADEAILARVGRPLKEEEKKQGLTYHVFGTDVVAFAAGSSVKVRNLTVQQLADIFSGRISNWREVGGDDARIRVLNREPGDACLSIIRQHLQPFRDLAFTQDGKTLYHDYEMVDMLNKYHASIGFLTLSTLSVAGRGIHPLTIDGIAPELDNVAAGRYRLLVDYALVYKEGAVNDLARRFVDFLSSETGVNLLKERGIIPAARK